MFFSDPVEGLLSVEDLMTRGETDDPATLIDSEKDLLVLPYSSGKNRFRLCVFGQKTRQNVLHRRQKYI